ncbi:capsular exopolysaccharide family [Caloramator fervidus]|uniref:non-specific protein-tyrosine kinase n=1 Tax=Caloramator fervidus TaxID=29344 RepID=A0A1H5T1P8_9CLOT|nr:CpsD/CapB family tyrosine-protein kinase [Caloramator fervidus]SEF56088.1 capsular exopolysaccharide family [Caloramator fervidus]
MKLITIKDQKSPISEAYRTLRTNINFSLPDTKVKTILITSSGPGEGKSTTSANLAVVFAQNGYKTIIVDCDLRKNTVHKKFGISNIVGLTNILIGEQEFDEKLFKYESVENLYVLPAGTRPPNPVELLSSRKMERFIEYLKQNFDVIIIDAPPVLVVTDAQILSQYVDGVVFVVASEEADKHAAKRAKELLEKANTKILGVVLNKLDTTKKGYYGYYYYYYYGHEKIEQRKARFLGR